ncbi:PTS sugar transporter subunit IIA [Vibrio sp. JC009]|uniref:PTS sugar transporter subunit IIA n=1 Tax=Vibrio sp. JC009 TaxID=2912314 RepID=UPI0023B1B676|nr:PTS sugar transporter subunit IIA [Vibrio sp. JC009]WED24259.1 PTS sugar transporter subunit IIA [Vibrio sp. JC009]
MKIERRITFVIGSDGFAGWKVNRLKALSGYFRSVVILKNITKGKWVNAGHTLKVLSLGSKDKDLCQLWIEGSDAELACMVLTDFIAAEFDIISTSHSSSAKYSNNIIDQHPAFRLDFGVSYNYLEVADNTELNKNALLLQLASLADGKASDQIFQSMLKREEISSTGIGHEIALPHVMLAEIDHPLISVVRLPQAVDWHSKRGPVSLIIGFCIPAPPEMPVIKSFTQLSRTLLNEGFCQLLTSTPEPETLKAILLHIMSHSTSDS